ncbi:MAG: hypothetical protein MJZ68_01980 [archaeon]|nr:hypothetical protein [archaeon]
MEFKICSCRNLLMALCAIVLALAVLAMADCSDADPSVDLGEKTISGEYVLSEDEVFDDGTVIVIESGTKIVLANHTLDLGKGSHVFIKGALTVVGEHGSSIIVGAGTMVFGDNILAVPLENDVTVSFAGVLSIESMFYDYSRISYVPESPLSQLNVTTELFGKECTFYSLAMVSNIHLEKDSPSGILPDVILTIESLQSGVMFVDNDNTVTVDLEADPFATPTLRIVSSNGKLTIDKFNVKQVSVSFLNHRTGLERTIALEGIGSPDISIEKVDESLVLNLSLGLRKMTYTEMKDGSVEHMSVAESVVLTASFDIGQLMSGSYGSLESWIISVLQPDMSIKATAEMVTIHESLESEYVVLEKVSVEFVSNEGAYGMVLSFNTGTDRYDVTVSGLRIDALSLSEGYLLNASFKADQATASIQSGEKLSLYSIKDMTLEVSLLDYLSLRHIFSINGKITVQNLVDNCEYTVLGMGHAEFRHDLSEKADASADNFTVDLRKARNGLNTATLELDRMKGTVIASETSVSVDFENVTLYFETDGELTTEWDLSVLVSDTHSKLLLSAAKFQLSVPYSNERSKGTVQFDVLKRGEYYSTDSACIEMQYNFTLSTGELQIRTKYDLTGYDAWVTVDSDFIKIPGKGHYMVKTEDMVGSSMLVILPKADSIEVGISAALNTSVKADIEYYGINVSLAGEGLFLNIGNTSKVIVYVNVPHAGGLVGAVSKMAEGDFKATLRGTLTIDNATLVSHQEKSFQREYNDMFVKIGALDVDMKRGDRLTITMDDTQLFAKALDGTVHEKFLSHFVTEKDLSEGGNTNADAAAAWMIAFIVVIVAVSVCSMVAVGIYRHRH